MTATAVAPVCTVFGLLFQRLSPAGKPSNRRAMPVAAPPSLAANPAPASPAAPAAPQKGAVRWFGRLQLVRLLGRSERTMAWSVLEFGQDRALMLVLPRVQPPDALALQQWQDSAKQVARLKHPQLAPVLEVGARDGWPFVLYDMGECATLADQLGSRGLPGPEAAPLLQQVLQGLAFVHEAGLAHHDLQDFLLLVDDKGQLRVAGTGTAQSYAAADAVGNSPDTAQAPLGTDTSQRNLQRAAAERDVLACGLLMYQVLVGQPPLDEADAGRVIRRMPPLGHEVVRLPWNLAQPLSEPLRTIVNRCTDRNERQRYRNARTLLRALEGWLQSDDANGGGPMALLSERLRIAGVLPSTPGTAQRAARLAMMDRERTNELAEVVLEDLALSFEMLRLVNSAQVRAAQAGGGAPVLTVRRAIAMLGLDGVRRAALPLRNWPGPLDASAAAALQKQMARSRRTAQIALALRPAGYDSEVVFLVTVLQDLGRLVVRYHFPEEALQIERLMQPADAPRRPGETAENEEAGMTEQGASFAVLGADTEAIGQAVARYWGLDDDVLVMTRRLPLTTPVHKPTQDDEMLRTLASCAHEVTDALTLPGPRVNAALSRVVQRYGHALDFNASDLQAALREKPNQAVVEPARPVAAGAAASPPAKKR